MGAPALPFRIALGSLIIKEKLGTSDRKTVEQIKENPYLQYFIGQTYYSNNVPFDASLLVRFRERINVNLVSEINQIMVKNIRKKPRMNLKKKLESRNKRNKRVPNQGRFTPFLSDNY
jgi:hypothetical protein